MNTSSLYRQREKNSKRNCNNSKFYREVEVVGVAVGLSIYHTKWEEYNYFIETA